MDIKDLKLKIDNYYIQSLSFKNSSSNSIALIDAVKSLVGINIVSPSLYLIEWLEKYLDQNINKKQLKPLAECDVPEVVSFKDLELSLIEKNFDAIEKNLFCLSRVSDGRQLLEFLLESSLKYCGYDTHKYLWSIYRMELFLSNKYISYSLKECCRAIVSDFIYEKKNSDSSNVIDWKGLFNNRENDYNELSLYYSIYNSDLIRKNKVNLEILNVLSEYQVCNSAPNEGSSVSKNQLNSGRKWLLDYINSNPDILNEKNLLFLNSTRSCLQYSSGSDFDSVVWSRINERAIK